VTESSPHVDVTVVKKAIGQEITVGIRTVEDTAKEAKEFNYFNKVFTMKKNEHEKTF